MAMGEAFDAPVTLLSMTGTKIGPELTSTAGLRNTSL
jgi:hypothetical protein